MQRMILLPGPETRCEYALLARAIETEYQGRSAAFGANGLPNAASNPSGPRHSNLIEASN
jgi:hypothetical protein